MEKLIFEQVMASYKLGTYVHAKWMQKGKNGVKISEGIIRLTNKTVYTSDKGKDYVNFRVTKNPRHKTKVQYISYNGEVMSKSEWEGPSYQIDDYFRKRLEDIITIR